MQSISLQTATDRLLVQVRSLGADDVAEAHNELFPQSPISERDASASLETVRGRLAEYLEGGVEPEEIVALWGIVFPKDRRVFYDEEDDVLRFIEQSELQPWMEY